MYNVLIDEQNMVKLVKQYKKTEIARIINYTKT